jgi:NADH-quinone oxidoreductase subunit A
LAPKGCGILGAEPKGGVLLADYGLLALFFVIAVLFALMLPLVAIGLRIVGVGAKRKPNPNKETTYECGVQTVGKSWVQFNFRYYFFALIFVVLDILTIFLYPWATDIRALAGFGLAAAGIFVAIVSTAWVYAWKKGLLEWK